MKRRITTSTWLLTVAGVATALLVGSQAVLAAPVNNSTNTLKISPVRRDVEIKPGESKTFQTTVTNLTDTAITVRAIENDFIAGDERGTPALILDESKFASSHSLKRYMKPIANIVVPAKETKMVDVVVTMPKDVKAGGYFGAIRFAPVATDNSGQVNLDASVASLLLVTVPGKVTEKLNLTNFEVQQNGKTGELFGSPDNLQVFARFKNEGGLQEGPFGKISVLQDDKKVVYEADFNNKNPKDVVLPDSSRRWDVPLKKIGTFGHYTVNATFTYGKNNQTIQISKSFWVIPQMMIIGAVVGVLLLIALIVGIVLFLKNRKYRVHRKRGAGLGIRR